MWDDSVAATHVYATKHNASRYNVAVEFLDRHRELARLDALLTGGARLAVVHGRRRIGKTRLLVEWVRRRGGVYTVADRSAPELQRAWLADAVASRLPAVAEATWPTWAALLRAIAREAGREAWPGPLVLDELPYLVEGSPELPSVLQRWVDHDAAEAGLVVVLAGSSQHLMQGLVLDASEPLYGRAHEVLHLAPLPPGHALEALGSDDPVEAVQFVSAWGGVPRYWELAVGARGTVEDRVDALVLDPLGPLHDEPDRLLAEESPPAVALRPILDALGAGAHRLSEIAGRIGRPATSLARPMQRLQQLGLVRRELPFGEPAASSKRSLYRIADPFLRLWFRVVAPHRAELRVVARRDRLSLFRRHWPVLAGEAWEELCRASVPLLGDDSTLGRLGPWGPASRWWHGAEPEWDVVAESLDGRRVLVGEARLSARSPEEEARRLAGRPTPFEGRDVVRALFVPRVEDGVGPAGVVTVGAAQVVGGGRGT